MIKRGNKVSTYESAREENLWLRWKQNSETKIRPLETHTDARTHTHAQTHFERRERKNTNAKKAQHGNKREREKRREKEPQERHKERVLLVILTISFVFFDVYEVSRGKDFGVFSRQMHSRNFGRKYEALEKFWAAVFFSLFVLCSCAHA